LPIIIPIFIIPRNVILRNKFDKLETNTQCFDPCKIGLDRQLRTIKLKKITSKKKQYTPPNRIVLDE